MPETTLEQKLKNVKETFLRELQKGEIEQTEFWDIAYKALYREGIIEGGKDENTVPIIKISVKLVDQLGVDEPTGLNSRYYVLRDSKLSDKANEDVQNYKNLILSTREYLQSAINWDKPITKSEFYRKVSDYLLNNTKLRKLTSKDKQQVFIIKCQCTLESEFNIKKDSEMIGNYSSTDIDQAIAKI